MKRANVPAKSLPFRGALLASGLMAFADLGDALLYPVLPVCGKKVGYSVFCIGILLSANRFVRIFANTYVANIVNKQGRKKDLFSTTILAAQPIIVYGFGAGIILFLILSIFILIFFTNFILQHGKTNRAII
ncbi:MAG: hypothetical protein AAF587_06025 [Bacteroidota bacterium]